MLPTVCTALLLRLWISHLILPQPRFRQKGTDRRRFSNLSKVMGLGRGHDRRWFQGPWLHFMKSRGLVIPLTSLHEPQNQIEGWGPSICFLVPRALWWLLECPGCMAPGIALVTPLEPGSSAPVPRTLSLKKPAHSARPSQAPRPPGGHRLCSCAPGHAARTEEEEERWRKRRRKRRRKEGGGPEGKSALGRSADCSLVPSAPLQGALTTPGSGKRRVGQKEGQRSRPAPSPQVRHPGGSYRDDSLSAASEPPLEAGTTATSLYKLGILGFTRCPRPAPAPRGGSRTPGAGSRPLHKRIRVPASGSGMRHFLATRLWKKS